MERLTYTITEVAQVLGISRSKAYELVAEGLLPVVPLPGRRKLVARAVLERLVEPPGPRADHQLNPTSSRPPGMPAPLVSPCSAHMEPSGRPRPQLAPITA
jgi:excisionase family DNA binding protein